LVVMVGSVARRLATAVAIAAVIGACGGTIDKGKLETGIKDETNKQLAGRGTVTSVSCVAEGNDGYHFSCLVVASDNSRAVLKATCDKSGSCVWRPE
jgi:hypothetical protein